MEAYTSTLGLLTYSLILICLHNALVSHLKIVPGFWACFIKSMYFALHRQLNFNCIFMIIHTYNIIFFAKMYLNLCSMFCTIVLFMDNIFFMILQKTKI